MKKSKKVSDKESKYQTINNKLIALLEQGTLPWRKDWNSGGGDSFQNPISKSVYKGINPTICMID